MKTIVITFAITISILIGFAFTQQKVVKDSGTTRTEDRKVEDFNKIRTARSIKVLLTQGETLSVKVEADINFLPYIETNVSDHTLYLTIPDDIKLKSHDEIKVYVTMPTITELHTTTSAEIKSTTLLKVNELDLSASTSGEIEIEVKANQINSKVSTSGEITLKGATNVLFTRATTSGEIDALELEAQQVSAQVRTSAEIKIYAVKKLDYDASTSGEIHYKGSPLLNGKVSTGGEIIQIK